MDPIVLRAVRPVPRLRIQPGDLVILDPEAPDLLTRWRPKSLPNIGAALLAFEDGALEAECPTPPSSADLARVVGLSSAGSPSRWRVRPARHLRVVR